MSAGEKLQAAAVAALEEIEGLAVYDAPPLQAAFPYALTEAGPETDWSHKGAIGREVRLAVTIRDRGERPVRLRGLMNQAEAAMAALAFASENWQLVTIQYLRSRLALDAKNGWAGIVEYRARMLQTG